MTQALHTAVASVAPLPSGLLPEADILGAGEPAPGLFTSGVYRGKLNLQLGPSGVGKSFLALQQSIGLAVNRGAVPGLLAPNEVGRVLYLSGEEDAPVLKKRLRAISDGFQIPWNDIEEAIRVRRLVFVCTPAPMFRLGSQGVLEPTDLYAELSRRAHKFDMVVIDPLAAWGGIGNENDNVEMSRAAQYLIRIAESSGCALLLLHHSNKMASEELSQNASRGASALACAARWIANMRTLPQKMAERYDIAPSRSAYYCEFALTKNSYASRDSMPIILERNENGVLSERDFLGERVRDIAWALAKVIHSSGAKLTERELVNRAVGRPSRDAVEEIIGGKVTSGELKDAVKYALDPPQGAALLRLVEVGTGGKPRRELLPCE